MEQKKQVRYGISDIILEPHQIPSKYVQVFDESGNLLGESEVFYIEEEHDKEEE